MKLLMSFAIVFSLQSCATINQHELEPAPKRPDIQWMEIVGGDCIDESTPVLIALTPDEMAKLLAYIYQLEDRLP